MDDLLERINSLKTELDALRPLPKEAERRIFDKFRFDWNFHSNSLEGNSLSYGETRAFLLHGLTASGKPLKDYLDIKGHNEAILGLEEIVQEERPLTEALIRELHQLILAEPYEIRAVAPDGRPTTKKITPGKYKTEPNFVRTVTGEKFVFASPEETPIKMRELIEWFRENKEREHPLVLSALFHHEFTRIHPFDDGNGRLARILMNLILMQAGFPPVIIPVKDRETYYRSIRAADGGDTSSFFQYIAERLIDSLEITLRGAKGESIDEDEDLDKKLYLLKKRLAGEYGETELIRQIDADTNGIYRESFIPLVVAAEKKMKKFKDFFQIFYLRYGYKGRAGDINPPSDNDRYTSENEYDIEDEINPQNAADLPSDPVFERNGPHNFDYFLISSLRLDFKFEEFRFGKEPFNLDASLIWHMSDYSYHVLYVVGGEQKYLLRKTYREQLTEKEITAIARDFADSFYTAIEIRAPGRTQPP